MAANGTPEQPEQPQPQPQPQQSGGGALFGLPTQWVIIGGAGGGVALIVIIVAALFFGGAFGGGGGGASGGSDLLAYVPGDASAVAIIDVRAYYGGDVPDDIVDHLEEGDGGAIEKTADFLDIDEDDLIITAASDEALQIVQGDFDFDVIREELEDGMDCEEDEYRGFEMWVCRGQDYPAVALFEGDKFVVLANWQDALEEMLTLKSREPEKLADNGDNDINRLLSRTDGWMQFAIIGDGCSIDRCEGVSIGIGKKR